MTTRRRKATATGHSVEEQTTAWKAVQKFRAMLPQLESFLRSATDRDIKIVLRSTPGSSTDGNNVYLCPPYELGFDLPHNVNLCDRVDSLGYQRCKACAIREEITVNIYHEASHIVFGTFDGSPRLVKWDTLRKYGIKKPALFRTDSISQETGQIDKYMTFLFNALEDIRVDREMYKARPGLERMGLMSDRAIAEGQHRKPDGTPWRWLDEKLDMQVITALYFRGKYGQLIDGMYAPQVHELISDPKLARLLDQTITTADVIQTFELGCKILFRIRELGFLQTAATFQPPPPPAPKPEPEPEPEQEQEDDRTDESETDTSTPPDDDESSDPGADEPDWQPDPDICHWDDDGGAQAGASQSQQGAQGDGTSGEGDGEPGSEPGEESEDASGDGRGEHSEAPAEHEQGDSPADPQGDGSGEESGGHEDGADPDLDGTPQDRGGDDESSDQETDSADGGSDDGSDGSDAADPGDGGGAEGSDLASPDGHGVREGDLNDDSDGGLQRPATDATPDGQAGTPDAATDASADAVGPDNGTDARPDPPQTFEEYAERHGDADDIREVVELLTGHDDQIHLGGTSNKDLIKVAIQQADHFEESSGVIKGVVEFVPVNGQWSGFTYTDSHEMEYYTCKPEELTINPGLFNKSRMRMRKAFEDNKRSHFERNLPRGRVNKRALGRKAWTGDNRLFEKKEIPKQLDYVVIISMDISGSTAGGSTLTNEKRAVKAQADLLHAVGVPFAIVAHTGEIILRGTAEDKGMPGGDYLGALTVKDFDEPWGHVQKQALYNLFPYSANLDGHAFEYMRRKIERRQEKKKLIIYYSDGAMPLENYQEELHILQRELKYCKRKGIGVTSVGINNNDPQKKHGIPMVLFKDETDILAVIDDVAVSLGIG